MNGSVAEVIKYRLSRANEAIEEARVLAQSAHWNACVNRLYYACFYAVSALLATHALGSGKHSGVRSLFNQHLVKSGIVSVETSLIYNDLFERRQEGDYEDFFLFQESDVKEWIGETSLFVERLAKLAAKNAPAE
jgi:uncharacterized protein (UPF0332 family)